LIAATACLNRMPTLSLLVARLRFATLTADARPIQRRAGAPMTDEQPQPTIQPNQTEPHPPLLSVTVLNYNYAHYLPQCLDSILRQTWTDFELLLINDCSTDNSLEVIQPYLADPRVTLINHEQNQGYIASLIEGSDRSRGKYLTVISADDFCVSDRAFETLLETLEANPAAAWAHSAFGKYGADGTRYQIARHHTTSYVRPGSEEYGDLLLMRTYVLHSGVIIRGTAYKAVGGYNPLARFACDNALWLMLCSQGDSIFCAQELFAYRQHGLNMSHTVEGIQNGLREHIAAIDTSFTLMRTKPGITPQLYQKAIKRILSVHAEDAIFAGRIRVGWSALWCAMQLHPAWTLLQIKIPILLVRTVLGARGYHAVRSCARYFKQHMPHRAAFA
jgi:glycosyltransferase involved in cell wall biosynthesis